MAAFGKGEDDVILDLGNPLVNRSVDAFLKVGAIGAIHATSQIASREAADFLTTTLNSEKSRVAPLQLEEAAFQVGKQALQWGLASGIYSGVTVSLKEARGGVHDWKNAMIGGALAGAAVSVIEPNPRPEAVVSRALTGGAIAVAADFLEKLI